MSKRLQTLIEQTQYLLDRQVEAKEFCSDSFESLLSAIDAKIKKSDKSQTARLEKVHAMISGQAQQLLDDTEADISFLQEQLGSLKDITKIQDVSKARELLEMIIDPSEEIPSFEEFKQTVGMELVASQDGFRAVIEDLEAALEEGDLKNLEIMLEQMVDASDEGDDEEDEDEDECGDEDGCGSACSSGGCGSCETGCGASSKDGVDIFDGLSAYDRELAKDLKEKR